MPMFTSMMDHSTAFATSHVGSARAGPPGRKVMRIIEETQALQGVGLATGETRVCLYTIDKDMLFVDGGIGRENIRRS